MDRIICRGRFAPKKFRYLNIRQRARTHPLVETRPESNQTIQIFFYDIIQIIIMLINDDFYYYANNEHF